MKFTEEIYEKLCANVILSNELNETNINSTLKFNTPIPIANTIEDWQDTVECCIIYSNNLDTYYYQDIDYNCIKIDFISIPKKEMISTFLKYIIDYINKNIPENYLLRVYFLDSLAQNNDELINSNNQYKQKLIEFVKNQSINKNVKDNYLIHLDELDQQYLIIKGNIFGLKINEEF